MRFSIPSLFLFLVVLAPPAVAQQHESFQGQFLVATPDNLDPRFDRTVVYMVEHTPKTAYGIVVNKPYGKGQIADLMKGLGLQPTEATRELPLHYGGPVAYKHAFFLHTSEYDHARGEYIDGAVTFTRDATILKKYAEGIGPRRLFVALGYAGWRGGQLEGEIERGYWTLTAATEDHIFGGDKDTLWKRVFGRSELPL